MGAMTRNNKNEPDTIPWTFFNVNDLILFCMEKDLLGLLFSCFTGNNFVDN